MGKTGLCLALVLLALGGCAYSPYEPDPQPLEPGRLPPPDVAVRIERLGPCTDSPDRTLRINPNYPVTVLVHGCNGSAGRFRSLAQLYAFHGQQSVCFSYDDRDSLLVSSAQLAGALDELAGHLRDKRLTVIGHSMGGLVARKSLELEGRGAWRNEARITLATVSAPVSGIAVSSTCGVTALQWLSLGILPASCWLVTGDNWNEITPYSDFIRRPGPLLPSVQRYLKVVTDERGTCRRRGPDGTCRESDYVFTLAEQYQPVVDKYPQLTNVEVDAGHVEIVGYKDVAPRKLLAILQRADLLAPTPPERRSALEALLAILY
ncbi:MAG: alpha/beta fold hydrolase [Burkholderiales bacterium]